MKKIFTLAILLTAVFAFAQAPKTIAPGQNAIAMRYAETISQEDLKQDLNILASDALEGRETGKRGQKMAAAYIRAHYQEIGIEAPVNNGSTKSYFQNVALKKIKPGNIYLVVNGNKFKNIEDGILYYGAEKNTEEISTEVVFAGSGSAKDFENIDVKGKAVLIINVDRKGRVEANKVAKEKGATFMFIVRITSDGDFKAYIDKYSNYFNKSKMSLEDVETKSDEKLGFIYVSPSLAGEIFDQSFDKLTKSIDNFNAGKSNSLKKIKSKEVSYKLDYEKTKIKSENVLGYL